MNRYYINHPRGFIHEYTVYVVPDSASEKRLARLLPDAIRINRATAIYWGVNRPREARRLYLRWYGALINSYNAMTGQGTVPQMIARAVTATIHALDELENERSN